MFEQRPVRLILVAALSAGFMSIPLVAAAQAANSHAAQQEPLRPQLAPALSPTKEVDLMTPEGSAIFGAQWKCMEAKVVQGPPIPHAMPGYVASYDIVPHAGKAGFDDSSWPVIGTKGLTDFRGGGKVSFMWYRANLTIPAKVGDFDTAGATVVLTVAIDDYAEVWVNGQLTRSVGYTSPATIQGFNMPNRVVLADSVKPGDTFQIAVFGINGPISVAPMNFIFFREATIGFYR